MELSVTQAGDTSVITIGDERIDAAAAVQFRDRMREEISSGDGHLLLDLTEVNFVDSSGLGAIVSIWKSMDTSRRFALCGLRPSVERVFRLTRLDEIITVHATREDALAAGADAA